jgi:hypothetical protein
MKYFPQRLWLAFNNRRPSKRDAAFKEWEKNFRIYKRSLRGILPKLSPSARKFFATALLLHDGTSNRSFSSRGAPKFWRPGYDELSLKRKSVLQHEILFSSGAAISIEFEKVSVRRRLETR